MVDNAAERPRAPLEEPATNEDSWLNCRVIRAIKKMKLAGLRQALKPGVDWKERLWWVGGFFICFGFSIYLTVETIREYNENPILYTFDEDESIYNAPFPATTMTGTMIFRNETIVHASRLYRKREKSPSKEFEYEGKTWSRPLVDILIFMIVHFCNLVESFRTRTGKVNENPLEKFDFEQGHDWLKIKDAKLRDNVDQNGMKDNIIPFLKEKTLDCRNILAACVWAGKNKSCDELFVPVQTDVGTGCSFNRIPESLLRNNQGLMSLFHDHKYPDAELNAWKKFAQESLDSVIHAEGLQDFIDMIRPRRQRHAGKLRGLSFMAKFDQDVQGMNCPIVNSYGYLLAIHSPLEEPQMLRTGVTIPPKHEIFVNVNAEITLSDQEIESVHISKRKCYFQKENTLQNFKIYTQGNCHQECLDKAIQNACNCTLLTLSDGKNEPICGPTEAACVQNATEKLEEGGYDKLCVNPVCHPLCNDIKYRPDASYLPYYNYKEMNKNQTSENLVTSIIHVAQHSNSVTTRRRKLQFKFSILVGVIGGLWGMTLEFSVFTFFNVIAGLGVLVFSKYSCCEEGKNLHDEEAPAEDSSSGNDDSRNPEELALQEIVNENDPSPGSEESQGEEIFSGSNEDTRDVQDPRSKKSHDPGNENDVHALGDEEGDGDISQLENDAANTGDQGHVLHEAENENDQSTHEEDEGGGSPHGNDGDRQGSFPHNDTMEESNEEYFDSLEEISPVVSDIPESSSLSESLTKENESETTPTVNDSNDIVDNAEANQSPEDETSTTEKTVGNESETSNDLKAEFNQMIDEKTVSSTEPTAPVAGNLEVSNESVASPQEQNNWLKVLDELLEMVRTDTNQMTDEETMSNAEPNEPVAGNLEVSNESVTLPGGPNNWLKVLDELLEMVRTDPDDAEANQPPEDEASPTEKTVENESETSNDLKAEFDQLIEEKAVSSTEPTEPVAGTLDLEVSNESVTSPQGPFDLAKVVEEPLETVRNDNID